MISIYIMHKIMSLRNKISLSSFFTGILVVFVLAMLFSPRFTGVVMQNLMKIRLFQPSIPDGLTVEVAAEINTTTHTREILFKNMNDEVIELSDQKGKVVFVNFWATWCPPCIAEMPTINKLYSNFIDNENVMFMMVDVDNDQIKSQKFMYKNKYVLH